jgi:hypothetical protein
MNIRGTNPFEAILKCCGFHANFLMLKELIKIKDILSIAI